jgi:hypothetical protein
MKKYFDKTFWVSLLIVIVLLLIYTQTQGGGLVFVFSNPSIVLRMLLMMSIILIPFVFNYLILQYSLRKSKILTFISIVFVPAILIYVYISIPFLIQGTGFINPRTHLAFLAVIYGAPVLTLYLFLIYLYKRFTAR